MVIAFLDKMSYLQIDDANLKGILWTFKKWMALKCECVVEFLFLSY